MTEYIKYAKVSALKRSWKPHQYHNYKEMIKIKNCWRQDTITDNFDKLYIGIIPHKYLSHFEKYMTINDYSFCIDCELGFIVGYMLLYRKDKNKTTQHIELCDTIIPKLNILENMIKHYQDKYNVKLHPLETILTSNQYWVKYYKKHFNIQSKEEYNTFCNLNDICFAVSYN